MEKFVANAQTTLMVVPIVTVFSRTAWLGNSAPRRYGIGAPPSCDELVRLGDVTYAVRYVEEHEERHTRISQRCCLVFFGSETSQETEEQGLPRETR